MSLSSDCPCLENVNKSSQLVEKIQKYIQNFLEEDYLNREIKRLKKSLSGNGGEFDYLRDPRVHLLANWYF